MNIQDTNIHNEVIERIFSLVTSLASNCLSLSSLFLFLQSISSLNCGFCSSCWGWHGLSSASRLLALQSALDSIQSPDDGGGNRTEGGAQEHWKHDESGNLHENVHHQNRKCPVIHISKPKCLRIDEHINRIPQCRPDWSVDIMRKQVKPGSNEKGCPLTKN